MITMLNYSGALKSWGRSVAKEWKKKLAKKIHKNPNR